MREGMLTNLWINHHTKNLEFNEFPNTPIPHVLDPTSEKFKSQFSFRLFAYSDGESDINQMS